MWNCYNSVSHYWAALILLGLFQTLLNLDQRPVLQIIVSDNAYITVHKFSKTEATTNNEN